jgi:hypothetical protein
MKRHSIKPWTALLFAFLWLCWDASTLAEEPPLVLRIKMEKTTSKLGEPILVNVELLNRSEKRITVYGNFILEKWFLSFVIEREDGSRVKFLGPEYTIRPEYLIILDLEPMSYIGQQINLLNGENINSLNKGKPLYQIDKKGNYKIKAIYSVVKKKKPWRGTITSNELSFTVE